MKKWLSHLIGTTWSFEDGWRAELHYQYFLWSLRRRDARLRRIAARGPIQLHLEPPRWFVKSAQTPLSSGYVIVDRKGGYTDSFLYENKVEALTTAELYNRTGTDRYDVEHDKFGYPVEVITWRQSPRPRPSQVAKKLNSRPRYDGSY